MAVLTLLIFSNLFDLQKNLERQKLVLQVTLFTLVTNEQFMNYYIYWTHTYSRFTCMCKLLFIVSMSFVYFLKGADNRDPSWCVHNQTIRPFEFLVLNISKWFIRIRPSCCITNQTCLGRKILIISSSLDQNQKQISVNANVK